ncbi:MAG: sodium:proton antiporter [Ignavibacteriales bacterium]|nr:sodium:proton antiporter [Ignavibacteriales bacterium]
MGENVLIGLAAIIVFGIFAQWFSWILRLPSILLLLVLGFIAGPVTGLLNPDEFFGELLFPFVSISVAIILFEGGLSLKISELKPVLSVVRILITIGTIITWLLTTLASVYFLKLSIGVSLLLGAILVVTGPTVIIPLLRLVKPKGKINSILKWEGIVNDPIGAMLALLVFDIIISSGVKEATFTVILIIIKTLLLSSIIGIVGAYILVYMFKKDYIPDYLQSPVSLATIVLVFVSSNTIQTESGLFAVTIMGIILANQKQVVVDHIIEFKENIGVLLLSALFIILAARLQFSDLELIGTGEILFVLSLILLIRPTAIFLSSIGSNLNWKEKIYLSWMAPRGIVAAAVTSVFSLELLEHGYEEARILVPIIFLVIIITILIYGLSAIPLAKILKLSDSNPQGILIAGINKLSLEIYNALSKHKIKVLLVDNNWEKVTNARQSGYNTCFGSVVAEKTHETMDLSGIGKFLALTPNKGINSLASIYFSKIFDSSNVYQIYTAPKHNQDVPKELRGTLFSSQKLTYNDIQNNETTLIVKSTKVSEEFTYIKLREKYSHEIFHPLFKLSSENKIEIFSEDNSPKINKGDTIISLILNET